MSWADQVDDAEIELGPLMPLYSSSTSAMPVPPASRLSPLSAIDEEEEVSDSNSESDGVM